MAFKAILILCCMYLECTASLICRRCNNALSLDDCTRTVPCAEECYMEKYLTQQLTTVYYGGCRSRSACQTGLGVHLPSDVQSVNCSSCCNTRDCNSRLCGIHSMAPPGQQCYVCDSNSQGGQGDVDDPNKCVTVSSCPSNEICGSQTESLGGQQTYKFKCLNKRICTLLTQRALEDLDRCRDPAKASAGLCGDHKRSGFLTCSACCADNRCNHGSCTDLLDRLYRHWKAHALDFHTLHVNGSAPAVPVG